MSGHPETPYFDERAHDFDHLHLSLEPSAAFCDDLVQAWVTVRTKRHPRPLQVLDLGGGTGRTALQVLRNIHGVRWHLVDASIAMLAKASEKLRAFGQMVTIEHRHLQAFDQTQRGGVDLALALMSVHHLRREERIRLYEQVIRCLEVDGVFLLSDRDYAPVSPDFAAVGRALRDLRLSRLTPCELRRVSELEELRMQATDTESDKRGHDAILLHEEAAFLEGVGFSEVKVVWRSGCDFVIWACAGKPSSPVGEPLSLRSSSSWTP